MKTRLQLPLFTFLLTLLCLGFSSDGWGQYIVNFEGVNETKTAYASGTVTLSGLNWNMTEALIGTAAADWKIGARSARMRGYATSSMTMLQDKANGLGSISFQYRRYGTDVQVDWRVEYSTNGGVNWTQVGADFTSPATDVVQTFSVAVNITGNVRIRIKRATETGTSNNRLNIDDITLTDFTTGPNLTVLPVSITNLDYIEGSGPSNSQTFGVTGSNLVPADGNITVTAPLNFEVSLDNTLFSSSVLLPYTGGTVSEPEVFVRLAAGLVAATYNGSIDISGGDASTLVSVEGTVIEPFGLPYSNPLRTQADFDQAVLDGFDMSEVAWGGTGDGGYTRMPNLSAFVSPAIDFSDYNLIIASFDLTTFGGNTGQQLTVFVSDNNGVDYIALDTFSVTNTYQTFTQYIDVSALSGANGLIKFEMTSGTNQIRFRDLNLGVYQGYFYSDAEWFPGNPAGVSTNADDILVINGTATLTGNTQVNNLTINEASALNLEGVLAAANIHNDGSLIFKSTSIPNTAQLDTFTGSITGTGEVTIERFIPARRAFRFLSSAVTTSGTINANWQEGAVNATDNSNPGFGTHITGSTTGANGFDATPSGNPSLFTLNNTAQLWEAVTNTNVNTIAAGTPYRILVRGDRSVNVILNNAEPTNTILRTIGTLHTGPFTTTGFSQVADDSNFFGNPYPAAVDMTAVIGVSTNINPNFYYVWDPTLSGENGRGAYVMVDFEDGTTPSGSEANQFLQPGQAGFVRTLDEGLASLNFQEGHKNVAPSLTSVFNVTSKIDLRLFRAEAYTTGNTASDGLRLKFRDDYTNTITAMDALKLFNQDENLASSNDERLWNMESRYLPQIGESIPLFTNQYRTTDYVFEAELNNITGVTAYLRDTFTGEDVVLNNDDATIYAFTIDAGNPDSSASDRFEIVFGEEVLGTNDNVFGNSFVLYPNPVQNENFFIATRGLEGQSVTVEIHSMLGQLLVSETLQVAANGRVAVAVPQLPAGVFTATLTAKDGSRFTTKLINQ